MICLQYPEAIRRIIYTTQYIGPLNNQLWNVTTHKRVCPSDESVVLDNCIYYTKLGCADPNLEHAAKVPTYESFRIRSRSDSLGLRMAQLWGLHGWSPGSQIQFAEGIGGARGFGSGGEGKTTAMSAIAWCDEVSMLFMNCMNPSIEC